MKKTKTFEQMLKAYKAIRKQVMDAKLDDITCVEISEYNDLLRHRHWTSIEVNIGVGGEFLVDRCKNIRIADYDFDKGMANFKTFIAEFGNKPNN